MSELALKSMNKFGEIAIFQVVCALMVLGAGVPLAM
jgi:hypothetical protein